MIWRRVANSELGFELVGSSHTISATAEGSQNYAATDIGTVRVEQGDLIGILWLNENPVPYDQITCTDDNKIYYVHNVQSEDQFSVGNIYTTQILSDSDCRTYSVQVEIQTSKLHAILHHVKD